MHIGAARFDANLAQHGDRAITHDLVFFVRQRKRRRNSYGIARVHAHRIHVFYGTHDDGVVGFVAHDLHLVFFPTQQGLVDQDLTDGGRIEAGLAIVFIVVAIVGHAAACAAEGKGRADDRGQANLLERVHAFFNRVGDGGLGVFNPQTVHRFTEKLAIFGHFNGFAVRADQLDAKFLQHAHIGHSERGVEAGLTAHGRQQGVGALFFNDFGDHFRCDGFNIRGVGQFRVGHDRGGVRVDQDHPIPFFPQRFARLRARVVKFAGLSDDDGPGTDDHDGRDIGSFWHDDCPPSTP